MEAQRVLGPWTMTSLVVNSIIGRAVFGVPSEAIRLVGRRSPTAMVIAAVLMGIIILPSAEVASRLSRRWLVPVCANDVWAICRVASRLVLSAWPKLLLLLFYSFSG